MGVFNESAAALADAFAGAAGEAVTYSRGETTLAVTMWRPSSPRDVEVADADGFVETWQSWDWHVRASDLATIAPPQPGDLITAASGDAFEVLQIPGMACWSGGPVLRLHTKAVAAAESEES